MVKGAQAIAIVLIAISLSTGKSRPRGRPRSSGCSRITILRGTQPPPTPAGEYPRGSLYRIGSHAVGRTRHKRASRPVALSGSLPCPATPRVASWVKESLNQAAQEGFWEENRAEALARKLRLMIGVLSLGLPEVRKDLDDWIAWVR